MIRKEELRIGNKVHSPYHHILFATVAGMTTGAIVMLEEVTTYDTFEGIEAIPLSPEILVACGFKKAEGDYLKDTVVYENKIRLFQHDNNDYSLYGYNEQKVYVFYLHELQNLFALLAGQELTVNIEKVKV